MPERTYNFLHAAVALCVLSMMTETARPMFTILSTQAQLIATDPPPIELTTGADWSIGIWMHVHHFEANTSLLAFETNTNEAVVSIDVTADSRYRVRYTDASGKSEQGVEVLLLDQQPPPSSGELALLVIDWEASTQTLHGRFIHDGMLSPFSASDNIAGDFTPGVTEKLVVGARSVQKLQAHQASIALVVRNHPMRQDFELLWSRRAFSDLAQGGAFFKNIPGDVAFQSSSSNPDHPLNSQSPLRFALGFVHTTFPRNGLSGLSAAAAFMGEPASFQNVHIINRSAPNQPNRVRIVRNVSSVKDIRIDSPFDLPIVNSFNRRPPGVYPGEHEGLDVVSNSSPRIARMARGKAPASGIIHVGVPANSRGVRSNSPGDAANFTYGYIDNLAAITAGIGNIDPLITSGRNRPFPISSRRSGGVVNAQGTNYPRFWSGSGPAFTGPGHGVLLRNQNSWNQTLLAPLEGTLYTELSGAVARVNLLEHPGSPPARIWKAKAATRTSNGVVWDPYEVILDTARGSSIPLAVDSLTLTFSGDLMKKGTDGPVIGDAITGSNGGINVITGITFDALNNMTHVAIEHPWDTAPVEDGSPLEVMWGRHGIATLEVMIEPDPSNIYKGIRVERISTTGDLPIVVLSHGVWADDVDGWVFSQLGWGGNGFSDQIAQSFSDAIPSWTNALNLDVALIHPANQDPNPNPHLIDYTEEMREGRPDLEIAWISDPLYPQLNFGTMNAFTLWVNFILQQAEAHNVIGVSVFESQTIGGAWDFLADGFADDAAHPNSRGMNAITLAALHGLQLATEINPADINGDGIVNAQDLAIILGSWGVCPEEPSPCPADLNGDGVVNAQDLAILLGLWG